MPLFHLTHHDSCAQRVFRLDQDRINSLSYEQQVRLFECGVDWRACDGVGRDDNHDGEHKDDAVPILMME